MPSLKEVRIRISSIKSTQQITSAMKMVAASKLRRAQSAILQMRPYSQKLGKILQDLSASINPTDMISPYTDQREPGRILLVITSSNRGLCGAFNSNVIKSANLAIHDDYKQLHEAGKLDIITIGKKVSEHYTKRKYPVIESHDEIWDNLKFKAVSELVEKIMQSFAGKKYDKVEVIYNQFKNAAVQKLTREQFLPVIPAKSSEEDTVFQHDYIFEPDKDEIIRDLIPKSMKIQFYKMLLDSNASEHGARMTAMHQATDNAQEILKDLKLTYNKARQASITKELLEIVSGAEALNG